MNLIKKVKENICKVLKCIFMENVDYRYLKRRKEEDYFKFLSMGIGRI